MEKVLTFSIDKHSTVEELLEGHRLSHHHVGNDLDILGQGGVLFLAEHFREAVIYFNRVQPIIGGILEFDPEHADGEMARAAYLAAYERAEGLFREITNEMDGGTGEAMADYYKSIEILRNASNFEPS